MRELVVQNPRIAQTEIARRFGVSPKTVAAYLGRSGYSNWSVDAERRAMQMIEDEVPYGEIARTLGVRHETIRRKFGPSPHPVGRTPEDNRMRDLEIELGIREHEMKFGDMVRLAHGKGKR